MKMRYVLFVLLFLTARMVFAFEAQELRSMYYKASRDADAADLFYETLRDVDKGSPPLLMGYKAMASFMVCHHSYNPYTKLSYFSKGKELIDSAIASDPKNLDLRFLRFTVQTSAPGILNYRHAIEADKRFIFEYIFSKKFSSVDADLRSRIIEYMLGTDYCSNAEKERIRETGR